MAKSLNSIMERMPSATVTSLKQKTDSQNIKINPKISRLSCEVSNELKQQIKQYIANHPGETEKTIIMKALKEFGFMINEDYLIDRRSKN